MKEKEKSSFPLVKWAPEKESKEKETEVEVEPSDTSDPVLLNLRTS